jgi:hypothetical protein
MGSKFRFDIKAKHYFRSTFCFDSETYVRRTLNFVSISKPIKTLALDFVSISKPSKTSALQFVLYRNYGWNENGFLIFAKKEN